MQISMYNIYIFADWSSSLWNNAMPARRLPATGNGNKPVNSANLDMRWSPSRTSNFKHRTWIAGLIAWTVSHRTGSIRIRATWACDQVPTHLSAELIFATAWSGAAICSYGMTWGNRQPPSSQQLEQNSSPPQKKTVSWCNHPSPAATCMRCLRITLSFSSAFSKCSKSTDAKRALVLGPVQSNFDKNWWPRCLMSLAVGLPQTEIWWTTVVELLRI